MTLFTLDLLREAHLPTNGELYVLRFVRFRHVCPLLPMGGLVFLGDVPCRGSEGNFGDGAVELLELIHVFYGIYVDGRC